MTSVEIEEHITHHCFCRIGFSISRRVRMNLVSM